MFGIKKESAWTFETSATGGVGVEFVAVEGGAIYLRDPKNKPVTLHFGAAGAGISWGIKLPKIGKVNLPKVRGKTVGGVVAPAAFPNVGKLYILDTFRGAELTRRDITGACAFVEVYAGGVAGGSASAILFGMNPLWLAGIALGPLAVTVTETKLLASATGLLLTAGLNVGVVAGAGIGGFLGGIV
jgi:hypothetical protein